MLQIKFVRLVECAKTGTIDVKNGNNLSVMQDRYNDLTIGSGRTSDMSGKLMDVRYDDCLGALPSRAAYSFAIRDACTCDRALERTKYEFVF